MKNLILNFILLFTVGSVYAQADKKEVTAASVTEQLTEVYQLDEKQQDEMLKVQERKFRNLEEIEGLRKTKPSLYIQKIRALKLGTDASVRTLLNEDQQLIHQQRQADIRKQKAVLYKELKDAGTPRKEIDYRISELEKESLLKS